MYNGSISGKGNFHWHADNAGFATSPFRIKNVELTFSAGSNYATAQIAADEDFCWIVGGHTTSSATLVDKNIRTLKAYKSSSKWYVRVDINESVSAISKMSVMVLGVNKDWCMYSP